jgi:hypothetical protein
VAHRGARPAEANIRFCAHPLHDDADAGANRADIIEEIKRLYEDGHEKTDTLFVYFSGHGFAFSDVDNRWMDALVCADFTIPENSGGCCINLDELRERLWMWLGPGEHFYFIDACRNLLSRKDIEVLGLGITRSRSPRKVPARHSLQSTLQGALAGVGSQFPAHLLAGLRGGGRAKSWEYAPRGSMVVHFRSLTDYLLAKMPGQPIDADPDGTSPGILQTIQPVPKAKCTITLRGLGTKGEAALHIVNRQNQAVWDSVAGEGETPVELPPLDYYLSVDAGGAAVTPLGPVDLDMYEPKPLEFKVDAAGGSTPTPAGDPPPPAPQGWLRVLLPPSTELYLRDRATGSAAAQTHGDETLNLRVGDYDAELRDWDGALVEKRQIDIVAGGEHLLDLRVFKPGRVRGQLLQAVKGEHKNGLAEFSEQLGPMADQDLGLWLAIVGASRILGGAGTFSKLGPLPLAEFKHVPPGGSAVYVLAGFDGPRMKLQVGISQGPDVMWRAATPVKDIDGLHESSFDSEVGPRLLSWRIGKTAPVTIASVALPNRATLITMATDEAGKLQVGQFILPLPHLFPYLAPKVREQIEHRASLQDVKFLYRAWRSFRDRDDVFATKGMTGLLDILYDKWIDPVGALLASYELIRRGRRDELEEVVKNLNLFFPDLPDTAAISQLVTGKSGPPAGAPLFLEGTMTFEDRPEIFPFPASKLNYGMTWTAWRGAVSAHDSGRDQAALQAWR